jgi:hypothetical protein
MSTLLLLLILAVLAVVGILLMQLADRIRALESGGSGGAQAASVVASDPAFHGLQAETLWQTLSGLLPIDADTLAHLRRASEPVLQRHIEEVYLDGVLDARQGIRVLPQMPRQIRSQDGSVAFWFPLEEAQLLYSIGQERAHLTTPPDVMTLERLGDSCQRLHQAIGLDSGRAFALTLLPAATATAPAAATPAISEAAAKPAAGGPVNTN